MTVPRRSVLGGLAALFTAACSKLVFVAANVPATFGPYRRRTDQPYGTGEWRKLDIYTPEEASPAPRPVVIFFYGGRWETGDKSEYLFVGAALAGLGCIAVLPNYRHYPEVKMAGFLDDAARATAWTIEHAQELGADPSRLYLMGHSAGAHIAAMIALDRRYLESAGRSDARIAGLIGLSGPYDFLPLTDADLEDMFGPSDRYADSQPINFVTSESPPALLFHGLKDNSVWPKNSINIAAALRAHGVEVDLQLFPKLGHADTVASLSIPARGRAPTLTDIETFLRAGPVNRPRSS